MAEKKLQARTIETQQKILLAAKQCFIESGFASSSIGKIAKVAGINHSLIFHHFGSKEALWAAVKMSIVEEASKKMPMLPSTELSLGEFLKQLISNSLKFYQNYPEIIKMYYWQRLEHAQEEETAITQTRYAQEWHDALKHYQQRGEINKNINLKLAFTLLVGILSSTVFDQSAFYNKKKDEKAYIEFCTNALVSAFK